MQTLGKFFAFFIAFFISVLFSFLETYIIISIAGMYDVDFITNLSFMQVLGVIFIFRLVAPNATNNKNEENLEEILKNILTKLLAMLFSDLTLWGVAYLILKVAF